MLMKHANVCEKNKQRKHVWMIIAPTLRSLAESIWRNASRIVAPHYFTRYKLIEGIEQNLLQLDRPRRVLPFQQWLSYLCAVIYISSSSFEHIEWWSISHLIPQDLQILLSPDGIERAIYILNECTPWQIVNLRPFYELSKNIITTVSAISRFCFAVRPNQHLGQQFVKCK